MTLMYIPQNVPTSVQTNATSETMKETGVMNNATMQTKRLVLPTKRQVLSSIAWWNFPEVPHQMVLQQAE